MQEKSITTGLIGGAIGGVLFGALMHFMGMMPMIAMMIGSESAVVGWIVHMIISVATGAGFALIFGSKVHTQKQGVGYGALYGVIWWVLGALTIMPLILGMDVQFENAFDKMRLMSLAGHLVFGIAIGLTMVMYPKPQMQTPPPTTTM